MDSLLQFLLTLFSTILALLLLIYFYQSKPPTSHNSNGHDLPQAGGSWPIIGHLHRLGGKQLTHKTLAAMADEYGPIFTIKLGSHKALVVSSWEMAKECLTDHDRVFSDRPSITASKLLGYNFAMFGFAPYGPYWREMRKIATIELLSNRRLDLLKQVRALEVETSIREVFEKWVGEKCPKNGVLMEMKQWFGDLTQNMAVKMVAGKRYFGAKNAYCNEEDEARRYQRVIREYYYLFGVFVFSDAIPFLGWLDLKKGSERDMRRCARELDVLVDGWLVEHKQRRNKRLLLGEGEGKVDQDFMDVMLTILEDDANISGFDADTITKATCLNLILPGSDTTMVPLTWALSALLNNRHLLEKAQAELDVHVGKERHVDESDIKNLVYLQAIVKESLRLYPPTPVIGIRSSIENCTLSSGYHVPAGTRLMVNVWKIHRDERVWPNPNEFQPERFLTSHKDVDVRGFNFELIPFGSGRRSCPGISLTLQMVQLTLASVLHCYDFALPSDEPVDMTESAGMTNMKATPLEVLLIPRLDSKLYGN